MKQAKLRILVYGMMLGIGITIGSFVIICEVTGLRFQPIYMDT